MKICLAGASVFCSLLTAQALAAGPATPAPAERNEGGLVSSGAAEQIWKDNLPARVARLYPARKFRYASEVSGGFTEARTCVVSARAMILPVVHLPVQGAKAIYAPLTSATAFDAVADLTQAQCQDLAKAKLKQAVQSVASALAAS